MEDGKEDGRPADDQESAPGSHTDNHDDSIGASQEPAADNNGVQEPAAESTDAQPTAETSTEDKPKAESEAQEQKQPDTTGNTKEDAPKADTKADDTDKEKTTDEAPTEVAKEESQESKPTDSNQEVTADDKPEAQGSDAPQTETKPEETAQSDSKPEADETTKPEEDKTGKPETEQTTKPDVEQPASEETAPNVEVKDAAQTVTQDTAGADKKDDSVETKEADAVDGAPKAEAQGAATTQDGNDDKKPTEPQESLNKPNPNVENAGQKPDQNTKPTNPDTQQDDTDENKTKSPDTQQQDESRSPKPEQEEEQNKTKTETHQETLEDTVKDPEPTKPQEVDGSVTEKPVDSVDSRLGQSQRDVEGEQKETSPQSEEQQSQEHSPQQQSQETSDSTKADTGDRKDDAKPGAVGTKENPADGTAAETRGDEDEIMSTSQSQKGEDDEDKIPDDFYYNYDEHMSKAFATDESGLPLDLLALNHSFGYDCHKRANLHMLDPDTAIFAAGNLVQILNLKTKTQTYIRSLSGGGVGALAVHPSRKYFAVAEKGEAPNIAVYEYPSLKLYRILRGGTEKAYAYVDFSPDGKLLASVGSDPDYMLTNWDWKQEQIVLRSKAFSQDVFRVTFSTELEGQLTSSGVGHIRFWKMAKTFTGLKLQGQLGKFGKTEISDIEGYVELPDGKVLSGCEWGNLLLWDGGLIKVEISRKGRKPCHVGPIQQIIMDEGELMTIGIDGFIKVWDFETVDTADVTDASPIFEMEPMNELKVGNNVGLKSIVKGGDPEEPTIWFAQDAKGSIWKLDLSFSFTSQAPEKLMEYHSGVINGCSASPISNFVTTIGEDGKVIVYDYTEKEQKCKSSYNAGGTCVEWMPEVVDPKGATILAGFADGVVRVLSFQKKEVIDVHGRKKEGQTELFLKQAFKPHSNAVTAIAVDNRGETLATGSADNTVFFFTIGMDYEPLGFVKTPSPVTSLQWSPGRHKKNTLLVTCREGQVLEYEGPEPGNFDTAHSFHLEGLPCKTHVFKSIKSRLRHEEELARKAKEEEERKKKEEEERRIRIERGLETESDAGEDEDKKEEEEKEPEEEWEPYIPTEPSPILRGFYSKEENKFWVSMDEFDAGYLYECEFQTEEQKANAAPDQLYEPLKAIPVNDSNDVPITCLQFSADGKSAIIGMKDGSVRYQPLPNGDLTAMGPHWSLNMHDNTYGHITHLVTSYDNKHLFTVGADGNFFTYEYMGQDKIEEKAAEAKAKIPSARKDLLEKRIDDVEDPKAYSIEDAKQKSEYDKMMKLAEEKKAGVRDTITGFRKQFNQLLQQNMKLPEHLRLDRKEFEMDPEIKRQLHKHTEEKIEQVKKEMAWEEDKYRIALEKLKARFKDVVECERIVVKAFKTPHEVCSFRANKLSDDFYQVKADMEKRRMTMLTKEEASRQATQDMLNAQSRQSNKDQPDGGERETTEAKITTTLKGSMGERITKALQKVEEKKKKRAARRSQWDELLTSKPSDDYEDPADVSAIKEAQENMGDYKLKSADDYVVPDHLRMNTDKARAKLILLKDLIHKHKYDFNQRLLSLRDKKINIIDKVKQLVGDLDKVQKKLSPEERVTLPKIPHMHPEELPEKKYEYTRESLLKFKEEHEAQLQREAKGVSSQGGFGGFGGGNAPAAKTGAAAAQSTTSSVHKGAASQEEEAVPQEEKELSELEKKIALAEQIRNLYERDRLITEITENVQNFDGELRCLRHEKFKLDVDIKNADLRHVTIFEELLLLKDFEKQENVLADKVESKEKEKLDMQNKIIDVQQKHETKKKDIEKLQEKEKQLHATFLASLGENNKFADYLTKVFKKKIKRSKKKAAEGEGSDEESDEDSDDDSDFSESEEESDSEAGGFDLDVCPTGCDQNLYDNTCTLREKRLDIEEMLSEEKKTKETLGKEIENLQRKNKVIDAALKTAENELEAFQLEKQRKINELDVVVTLKLHQIQYINNGVLPQDLSQSLIFEGAGVVRLQHRIKELEHEKTMQKKQMKEAKKKHVQLIKDKRVFDQRIGIMDEQTKKMMMQKFGRIVDLEKLETVTVNRQVEELKEKLRISEIECSKEVTVWDERIQGGKDEITQLIRENTNKLDQLNMLLGENRSYMKELDSRQKNLGDEFGGARKADVHEQQRLIQLVHLQSQEIEALKEEITLLSRKGGHILPPAQPPMPQSAQGMRSNMQN